MTSLKEILPGLSAIIIVLLVPHSGIIPLPFGYSIPILIFVWFFLKQYKQSFASIGFSFKRFEIKPVLIGTVAGILIFSFLTWVFFPLLQKIVELPPVDLGDFAKIKGNKGFYIFLLAMGWLVGGFYEEIIFHGFIFTRLEKMIPGKYAVLLSFLLTNVIFALYHLQLGTAGVINAFLTGSTFHLLMLYYKRNMWYAVFCHAVFDTIALTFIYAGYE
jgi:membrane protease YdiL (CAAX protease family)